MAQVGTVGSFLYNLSLSVYYLAVLKFNMKERDISRKVEPFLHVIPNGFSIATGIFLAVNKQYAPLQNAHACWVGVYPPGCLGNPDVICERGNAKTPIYANFLTIIPFCTTYFFLVSIMMVVIGGE